MSTPRTLSCKSFITPTILIDDPEADFILVLDGVIFVLSVIWSIFIRDTSAPVSISVRWGVFFPTVEYVKKGFFL